MLLFLLAVCSVHAQNIAGIGAQLIMDSTGGYTMPRILSLVQNSPADQCLHATDYIIKVDDVSCKNKDLQEIVAMIRGEAGTKVKITTSWTKDGKNAKDTLLTRVGMQVAGQQDPTVAFYGACEAVVQQMKKSHVEVIKALNSECGNYFFNFNAEAGTYRVRLICMEEKTGKTTVSFTSSAKVYDNDNEAGAVALIPSGQADKGSYLTAQMDGAVTFSKSCVGTIGVRVDDEGKKCKAMYLIVYK